MRVTIDSKLIEITRQLIAAKRIQDILSVPLPMAVTPLGNSSRLASFWDFASPIKMETTLKSSGCLSLTSSKGFSVDQVNATREPLDIAIDFGHAIAKRLGSSCTAWEGSMFTYMSGRQSHGGAVHFDRPEAKPNDMVGLTVTSEGSLAVPHHNALTILKKSPYAKLLDVKLSDSKLPEKLEAFYWDLRRDPLRSQMEEAMVENPINAFNMQAGITIHQQPGYVACRRVCSKIVMHFVHE